MWPFNIRDRHGRCVKCLNTKIVTIFIDGNIIDTPCDCSKAIKAHDINCVYCKGTGIHIFELDGIEIPYNCPTSRHTCETSKRLKLY